MSGVKSWRCVAVGVVVAATSAGTGMAQTVPITPPPLPAALQASPEVPVVNPSEPTAAAPAASSQPACSCGDRRGLSRWRWHRAHCKQQLQEHFIGYPEEFNEWPLGYALYAHAQTQVANGQAARMVFYHYDFVDGTSRLNVRGRDKLARVGTLLPTNFSPIVVERTTKQPGLDESRRAALVNVLAQGSFPVPAQRVVIGPPIADGITGLEAFAIFGNQLSGIASGGSLAGGVTGIGGFVGGGAAFTGAGLSGSAVTAVPR